LLTNTAKDKTTEQTYVDIPYFGRITGQLGKN
jgi:hypothetical protein